MKYVVVLIVALCWMLVAAPASIATTPPLTISTDASGTVMDGLRISTTTGNCLTIQNASNLTLRNAQIGPCGGVGIKVVNSTNIKLVDSYIHPERTGVSGAYDTGDGIFGVNVSQLLIQGNVVAFGETNIELLAVKQASIVGNYLYDPNGPFPRGAQLNVWSYGSSRSSTVTIDRNWTFTDNSNQQDAINVGETDSGSVTGNYIHGGFSRSGCGIVVDNAAQWLTLAGNALLDTGQCGIGVGSGGNHTVKENKVLNRTSVSGGGNTAMYVWNQYSSPCGPVAFDQNIAVQIRADGSTSSYWNGGGCAPVTVSGNVFGQAAEQALSPPSTKMPPPSSLPPVPYQQKADSPYSF